MTAEVSYFSHVRSSIGSRSEMRAKDMDVSSSESICCFNSWLVSSKKLATVDGISMALYFACVSKAISQHD